MRSCDIVSMNEVTQDIAEKSYQRRDIAAVVVEPEKDSCGFDRMNDQSLRLGLELCSCTVWARNSL